MAKKVLVSGCFDMLHSGHVAFLQSAAEYGDLWVALGSDKTIYDLKGRLPVNSEGERLYVVQSVGCVTSAFVSRGSGILDFAPELEEIRPDILLVNEDGNIEAKQQLCTELGIEYVVLERRPHGDLEARSTTQLRQIDHMPYRIDLAGGWLDQPFVSKHCPGAVITISLEPTIEFNERSGMASSTRRKAIELWGNKLPTEDPEKLAKILFCYDNPPGTRTISGSQDAIGLVYPGLARAHYKGDYWPERIEHCLDPETLDFVEQALYLRPLGPRHAEYDVLSDTRIDATGSRALAAASDLCWEGILGHNVEQFGSAIRQAFEAQIAMFPNMISASIQDLIDQYEHTALGWKLSGAGGGGYLILASEEPIEGAIRIAVRGCAL